MDPPCRSSRSNGAPRTRCRSRSACDRAADVTAPVSQVWGNIVLGDHGRSVEDEPLVATTSAPRAVRLRLTPEAAAPHQGQVPNARARAGARRSRRAGGRRLQMESSRGPPAIDLYLHDDATGCDPGADHAGALGGAPGSPRQRQHGPDFVVETDNAAQRGRFASRSHGVVGREPGRRPARRYRIGNGAARQRRARTQSQHVSSDVRTCPR